MLVTRMQFLFAISILCFCTVMWIALALARRLRIAQSKEKRRIEQGATIEFFEAGEFRTPRPLRLSQEITRTTRRGLSEPKEQTGTPLKSWSTSLSISGRQTPLTEAEIIAPRHNSKLQLVPRPEPPEAQEPAEIPAAVISENEDADTAESAMRRKAPQSARASGLRRVDLSHFTTDLGDLTDPYTHSLRGSGTQGPSSKKS